MAVSGMHRVAVALCIATWLFTAANKASAQATAVALTGTSYSQNFDGMATSASAAVPTGWGIFRSGAGALTPAFTSGSTGTVVGALAYSGSAAPTSGNAYLWVNGVAATGTDKSIGFLSTGSYPGGSSTTNSGAAILFGFTNNTNGTITNLDVQWDYEKYRSGSRAFDWNFFTSTDGSTWTANASGNQSYSADANSTVMSNPPLSQSKSVNVPALNLAIGSSFYMRWTYLGSGGWSNGQGLGIDNFSMSASVTAGSGTSYWGGAAGWTTSAPGDGGNGIWEDGSGGWTPANIASFGGAAGTVTTGTVTAESGLVFVTTGYTLSSGTVTLAASSLGLNSITTGSTAPFTTSINSVLAGSAGMTKLGPGTLVLAGNNTISGTLAISIGTLEIAADSALGNAANDIALAGTLKTTASMSLGSGRDVTGSGSFDIAPGTTLTTNGAFSMSAVTLSNGGTLDLQGSTRSVGLLTFGTAATVNGSGAISATGITASGVTSGTAVINPAITFSSGDKTVSVGAGGTLVLNGDIAGTAGRIVTNSGGRLIVSGSNSAAGFNIGSTSASPIDGGTVILGQSASLGTGQTFLNVGTLEAAAPISSAAGLSIGGREATPAVLAGSPMTLSGSMRFFSGFGATGPLRLDVNNTTTFTGTFGATGGTLGTFSGITIGGTGALVLDVSGTALVDAITLQDSLDLIVGGTLGSAVTVGAGNAIGGDGVIGGSLTLNSGADFIFNVANTLTVNGASVTFADFGISDLIGFSAATPDGSYTLIDGSAIINTANLRNLGLANAVDLGGGRSAYFTEGSLVLQVVPEPSAFVLAGMGLALAAAHRLRRRSS